MFGIRSRATIEDKHCYIFIEWDGEYWRTILGLPGSKTFPFFSKREALDIMAKESYSHDEFEVVVK